jgi:drug/metabolite transporter (DMT)-like permease
MGARKLVGIGLVILGVIALVWGGVFWTDRDTILDAGPLEVTTEDREGVAVPPVLGVIALIGGIVLLALPARRKG